MKDYAITCSSTCDLTKEYLSENNNKYVNFYYYLDDNKYKDDFFSDITIENFYNDLKNHSAKTSQPNPEQYLEIWEKIYEENKNIIHIELSSGISGAYNSALISKNIFLEKHKDAEIYIVDSLCASAGYGLLVHIANKFKKDNIEIKECFEKIEDVKKKITHLFCTSDLSQLFYGGRLSRASFTFGKLLNIVPVMHVNNDGKLEPIEKTRGISNALKRITDLLSKNISNDINFDEEIFISNSLCLNIVDDFIKELKNKLPNYDLSKIHIFNIGTVIGSHTGQGTIAVFYVGNNRL